MQMRYQFGQVAIAFDNGIGKFTRVAGGEAQALNTGDFMHDAQQSGKIAYFARAHIAAIGVHILPQ